MQGLDDEEVAWGDPEVENLAMLDRLETYGGRAAELVMQVRVHGTVEAPWSQYQADACTKATPVIT